MMRTTILVIALFAVGATDALAGPSQDDQAATAFAKQDWKTAAMLYGELVKRQPSTANLWHLGRSYMGLDRYTEAKDVLQRALAETPDDPQTEFSLAVTLDHLGDEDGAFKYLGDVAKGGIMPQQLQTLPALDHLRKDPRFAAVVEQADRAIHVCKYDDRYRALDPWLGHWDGYMDGQLILHEEITAEVEGCMVREQWEGTDGGHSRSENFYNPKTKLWEQVWVDAGGNVVKLAGSTDTTDIMQMVGDNIDPTGVVHRMRQTWTKNTDGTLRRLFEQSDDEGKTWQTVLDLELRPAKGSVTN